MTQASQNKPNTSTNTSLGAAAAAAATGNAKPPRKKAAEMTEAEKEAAKAERLAKANKIFVTVGTVHEFETIAKAEKFLNGEGAPTEYAVLRGKRIGTSKKVSLR